MVNNIILLLIDKYGLLTIEKLLLIKTKIEKKG